MTKGDIVIAFIPDKNRIRQLYVAYVERVNKNSVRVRYQEKDSVHWFTESVPNRYAKSIPIQSEIEQIKEAFE